MEDNFSMNRAIDDLERALRESEAVASYLPELLERIETFVSTAEGAPAAPLIGEILNAWTVDREAAFAAARSSAEETSQHYEISQLFARLLRDARAHGVDPQLERDIQTFFKDSLDQV